MAIQKSTKVKRSVKLDQELVNEIDGLLRCFPFASRHAIHLTALRAGVWFLRQRPDLAGEFMSARTKRELREGSENADLEPEAAPESHPPGDIEAATNDGTAPETSIQEDLTELLGEAAPITRRRRPRGDHDV